MASTATAKKAKAFTVTLEDRRGTLVTSISSNSEDLTPQDMMDGLLGGLAALYISTWGGEEGGEDYLSPTDFCTLLANKVLIRLADYSVSRSSIH